MNTDVAELWLHASRELDAAGVPRTAPPAEGSEQGTILLNLVERIRWLVRQRPMAVDLQHIEAERDEARRELADARDEIVVARIRDAVRRLHETSERAPDVRSVPMRLVRQDVFDELTKLAEERMLVPVHKNDVLREGRIGSVFGAETTLASDPNPK